MVHLGLYCPVETGHLNTMLPLGQEMQKRGHRVTFLGIPDAEPKVLVAGLGFCAIGEKEFPRGATAELFAQLSKLSGINALLYTMEWLKNTANVFLEYAPDILKQQGIEALLVDQMYPEGGTVADFIGIPFVTLCSALPLNQEANIPPFFTNWVYNSSWRARLRNQVAYQVTNPFGQPIKNLRLKYRQKWQLPPESSSDSQLAILSHQPAEFEFPRENLPKHFYFTGPYHNETSRKPVDFPWDKLTGQPIIYASMGTLQNGLTKVFQNIASACLGLDAQLVISLGGSATTESLPNLQGNPLIVYYAPQLELLKKASLFITHAGMNSTLESLTYGVPMVAIPVTNDQPGIAARIAWTGSGEVIPLGKLNANRLQKAVRKVFTEESYKKNALRLKEAIQKAGGVKRAADIIELAISLKGNLG